MKQIRRGVFETNSSSTHSICISKEPVTIGKHIHFGIGEYGWENDCVDDTASYLYTAILCMHDSDELLEELKNILDKHSIEYEFEEPSYYPDDPEDEYKYLRYGYIDHAYEARDFIDAVLSDEDMLMRYLFGSSYIYTGNDNQDACPAGCDIADATYYDWGAHTYVVNPYHDEERYEYFMKGN